VGAVVVWLGSGVQVWVLVSGGKWHGTGVWVCEGW
jgi:hypothetical protein